MQEAEKPTVTSLSDRGFFLPRNIPSAIDWESLAITNALTVATPRRLEPARGIGARVARTSAFEVRGSLFETAETPRQGPQTSNTEVCATEA